MRRREFIVVLGGAAAVWPGLVRAQQPGKLPIIGFLGSNTPEAQVAWTAAFVERLRELGWTEGRTVAVEYRWASGQNDRYAEIAAEFVRLKVDVIVTSTTEAVIKARQATSVIPIVFASAADPVGTGLVASLARPGGNVTGLSLQQVDTAAKRLQLLREVIPNFARLATLVNSAGAGAVREIDEVQTAARALGLGIVPVEIRRAEDIGSALETAKGRADALYVASDPLIFTNRQQIIAWALGSRMPTIYPTREYPDAGGLVSYGVNFPDQFKRAADLVDKILRGTRPADIPVEQPTKFDLVLNLRTARSLGLTIPESFLLRADEVIE
jgi:putative ABC transport system substrate-binding protein